MRKRALRIISGLGGVAAIIAVTPSIGFAQDGPTTQDYLNNLWVFIAGCLVFFMQAGFALVEAGLTRAKNVVNIFAKNMADAIIGVTAFFATGYALAFGGDGWFAGTDAFFLAGEDMAAIPEGGLSVATTFFFQAVFAATAVTIASGAMAERTKFPAYLIFAAVMCAFIYPVVVHWTWGGGLIADIEIGDAVYSDFAGSGIVHMTGGIAALMGAWFLGPRLGKYDSNGKPRAIPGHNIPFAIIGVFILWLGWFGFNPGSELLADEFVMTVAVNTMLAAVAGGLFCTVTIWLVAGKPDVAMIGNGVLAGLVAITAPCGAVDPFPAFIIGGIGGVLVVFSVFFFDRMKIDDPVGAISVHGVVGAWGVLSIGFFAKYDDAFLGREDAGLLYGGGIDQLVVQVVMLVIIAAWVAITTGILFYAIKSTIGLRVSAEEESEGLDVLEHGLSGYSGDLVNVG
ncbi:MAG: ammonium transporter [Ilumatobacter sp.]|uniref:ammonium transporter n=1 Tax=Ilumatobacter sp. TaxID=1967498 RepID=UPI00262A36CA|nr:ammonium transporter [Ilumatobacter sp.]MDJ0769238.1 ammonium transporter [Ilumatobacter sp.]